MKAFFLPLLFSFGLYSTAMGQEPVRVVTTIPDIADLTRTIGGDMVTVVELVPVGANAHKVLPKASMLMQLSTADALIFMGLDYEHAFLPALLEKCRNRKIQQGGPGYMNLGAFVQPLEVPSSLNRSQGADLHPRGNPHYNLDPWNGRIMAAGIRDVLMRVDPPHATQYKERWQRWDALAKKKIQRWQTWMQPLRGKKVVTYHRSWSYFVQRYGLVVAAEIEPKPGMAPSAKHLLEVRKTMTKENVQVVLMEPWYNENTIRSLVGGDVQLLQLPTTCGMNPKTEHYLDYIEHFILSLRTVYGLPPIADSASKLKEES